MATCAVCSKERQDGEWRLLRTARLVEHKQTKIEDGTRHETTYGDFREHKLFVCDRCVRNRDQIAKWVGIVFTLVSTAVLFVIAIAQSIDWLFVVALLWWIPWGLATEFVGTKRKLRSAAKNERGDVENPRAFDERDYKKLQEGEDTVLMQ